MKGLETGSEVYSFLEAVLNYLSPQIGLASHPFHLLSTERNRDYLTGAINQSASHLPISIEGPASGSGRFFQFPPTEKKETKK